LAALSQSARYLKFWAFVPTAISLPNKKGGEINPHL